MSEYDLSVNQQKQWLNPRFNNLTLDGNCSIQGTLTVSGQIVGPEDAAYIKLYGTSNQVIFQPSNTGTTLSLNATNPTSNSVITFQDPGVSSANVIYNTTSQTLSGSKTFSQPIILSSGSNQIMAKGIANTLNISMNEPSGSSRMVTFTDPGSNDTVIYANASQEIENKTTNGFNLKSKTFDLTIPSNENSIIMDGTGLPYGANVTINTGATNVSNGTVYTLPDPANGTVSSPATGIIAFRNTAQTFSGVQTFSSAPVISQITNTGTLTLPTITDTLVGRATVDTLTNKTLTSPVISSIVNGGTLTLPTSTDTLVGRATTDILTNKTLTSPTITSPSLNLPTITGGFFNMSGVTSGNKEFLLPSSTITSAIISIPDNTSNDTMTLNNLAQTLANKTLTSPIISQITNTGTLTLPISTDTLVGRNTTDTLTNKTLTSPVISTIVNTGTLTLPTSTDTLVGQNTTDTLNNKTFGANGFVMTGITGNMQIQTAAHLNSVTAQIPAITVGDVFVMATLAQTLLNKILTSPTLNNYVTAVAIAGLSATSINSSSGISTQYQLGIGSSVKTDGGTSITTGSTGYVTVPYAGMYYCSVHCYRYTGTVTANYNQQISIYINNSATDNIRDCRITNATLQHHELSGTTWLNANDQVMARMGHDNGNTLGFNGQSSYAQGSGGNNIASGWLIVQYVGN